MKRFLTVFIVGCLASGLLFAQNKVDQPSRKIFAYGGQLQKEFIQQVIILTGKTRPRVCFLPTASADSPKSLLMWSTLCKGLSLEPSVLSIWVNSSPEQQTFEEQLVGMDAIIVGGGSTLNMIALWKAQGIDTILQKAYRRGVVMAGGSAGSLCWFQGGYSDSRPQKLSIVAGLTFLPFSHCPHFHSEPTRKPLYVKALLSGKLGAGYACDDKAGILFLDEKYNRSMSLDINNHTYFLSVKNGSISEEILNSTIIK